jgi:hypothetical protein
MGYWQRTVIEPGKLPLFLLFVAFIATFLITRTITRLIRAGKGPFRNVAVGGTHLHHSTPGIILLTVGAFTSVSIAHNPPWLEVVAVVIGVGAALVFDEFAMVLHLQDVYWTQEGQQSVQAVGLVAAVLGLALIGTSPFGVDEQSSLEHALRISATIWTLVTMAAVVVCAMKGKFRLALVSIFVPGLAVVGAIRLARPTSRWAKRYYAKDAAKLTKSTSRESAFDARWDPRWRKLGDIVAGAPSGSSSTG